MLLCSVTCFVSRYASVFVFCTWTTNFALYMSKKPSLELASNNKEKDNKNQSSSAYALSLQFKGNNIIHHFMPSYNMSKQLHVRIHPAAPCNAIRVPVERTATYAWNVTRTKLQLRCASLQHRSSRADGLCQCVGLSGRGRSRIFL